MATILLEMLQRKAKFIEPQDVAAAVLSQGADETRKELVRLMAEDHEGSYWHHGHPTDWKALAWTLEETARNA